MDDLHDINRIRFVITGFELDPVTPIKRVFPEMSVKGGSCRFRQGVDEANTPRRTNSIAYAIDSRPTDFPTVGNGIGQITATSRLM